MKAWLEKKARKEDPIFLMQLQLLESVAELKSGIGDLKSGIAELKSGIGDLKSGVVDLRSGIGELRGYVLITAIMSAMLSNPNLTAEQIKEKFLKSVEVAGDIQRTIKQIAP